MTRDEFRQQYDAYEWDPYAPLAVILMSGTRAYIDVPEQATFTDTEVVITRRRHPNRPEKYPFADIARLVPLDQLPADPGSMSYAEFDPLIRELLMAEPFQPFVVELKTGERVEITRRPEIGRMGRFVSFHKGNSHTSQTYDHIARFVPHTATVPT